MTWQDALEIVVAKTKHEPFRVRCSGDNPDVESREAYRTLMVSIATGEPQPPAPLMPPAAPVAPDPWLPLIHACEDFNPGCCAHPAAFCTRLMSDVTREICIACLKSDKINP